MALGHLFLPAARVGNCAPGRGHVRDEPEAQIVLLRLTCETGPATAWRPQSKVARGCSCTDQPTEQGGGQVEPRIPSEPTMKRDIDLGHCEGLASSGAAEFFSRC